jgi:hypothetical protein
LLPKAEKCPDEGASSEDDVVGIPDPLEPINAKMAWLPELIQVLA